MEFSETFAFAGHPPVFSPNGQLLAVVSEYRVVVRDVDSLSVLAMFSCLDKITTVEWASNSVYLLCAMHKRGALQVWSVEDLEWTCKIDEGPAGLASARWSPDGLSIITVADFNVRLTIWSLLDASSQYLQGPKFADRGITFSPDGQTMAVLERKDCHDFLTLLDCTEWKLRRSFQLDSVDAAGVAWSPRGDALLVWDTPLSYKLLAYTPAGKCLASYSAYSDALGIKRVSWSPSGDFVAVASHDEVTRLLNACTWRPLAECEHPATLEHMPGVLAYQEMESFAGRAVSKYALSRLPMSFPSQPAPSTPDVSAKDGGTKGPVQVWDCEGRYLLTTSQAVPNTAWIWDASQLRLAAVLVQAHPIKAAAWSPQGCTLVLCTGSARAYLWTPAGASVVQLPDSDFQANAVTWNSNAASFTLIDRDAFCCTYLTE